MDIFSNPRRRDEASKVAEQAAEWLVVLEEATAEQQAHFFRWISESPLHVEAFLRAKTIDTLVARVDLDKEIQILTAGGAGPDITPHTRHTPSQSDRRPRRRFSFAIAAGVALICLSVATWLWHVSMSSWTPYHTAVGEQRSIELEDGSIVVMNTDSRLELKFSSAARELRLLSGEALFKVQRETQRPFRVHSADAVVQAIGTQFNVYRRTEGTTVSIIEGIVQISGAAQGTQVAPTRFVAGQEAHVAAGGRIAATAPTDLARVNAWRQRRLIFRGDPLSDIVEEFNRYNRTPKIRIEGAQAATHRYTAVFDADDPESLLLFLQRNSSLEFEKRAAELIIRQRAP